MHLKLCIGLVHKTLLAFVLLTLSLSAMHAQNNNAIADTRRPLSVVPVETMPPQDNQALLDEELARRGPGIAPRFAVTMEVDITPATHGIWETLPNGMSVWRLRISSRSAHSLNLGFTEYRMPEGGSLLLYSPDKKRTMGPFTPADNEEHEQLWTPIFEGDEMVIEVQVPAERRSELRLKLNSINHDFLGFSTVVSGSCNLDVICGAADGWAIVDRYRDIIQSVAVIGTNGSTFCTGFLINNARNDCTPYFMTANHCGINNGNAATLVAYWNYQNSFCRQPNSPQSGGPGNGSLSNFNTGSIFRASSAASDFTLVEFDDDLSPGSNGFFAGWVVADQTPQDTVICVHHPSTDEKRISFEFDPTYRGNWGSGSTPVPNGNHVIVPDYEIGTTEGGSSGSPLFDRHKRVVGQLHGGSALCGNDLYDSYGWFTTSWTGGGTPTTQLKAWLDPDNTGITSLDGRWHQSCSFSLIADNPSQAVCASGELSYTLTVSENFIDTVVLAINNLAPGLTATLSADTVLPGDVVTLVISGTENLAAGSYSFLVIANDGTNQANTSLSADINTPLGQPLLISPADQASGLGLSVALGWSDDIDGTTFDVEVAEDDQFTQIVATATGLDNPLYNASGLSAQQTYYWHVRAGNLCGISEWSQPFSFTTAAISCATETSTTPVTIPSNGTPTVLSTLEVTVPGLITEVRLVGLDIVHSWPGDVTVALTSPSGTEIVLIDRPGVPASTYGCDGNDFLVDLYDAAPNTAADLENSCGGTAPSISGAFQPANPLAGFNGQEGSGVWTLRISDAFNQDGGSLREWSLEICTAIPDEAVITLANDDASICINGSAEYTLQLGTGFSADSVFLSATDLPAGADITFTPNPAEPGDNVTAVVSGADEAGEYVLTFTAISGTDTTSAEVMLTVEGAPAQSSPLSPANNADHIALGTQLQWQGVNGISGYRVLVSVVPDFSTTYAVFNTALTSANLSGLQPNTVYYWRVDTQGPCGSSTGETIFQFRTSPDLNFVAAPPTQTICISSGAEFQLAFGSAFTGPAILTYTVTPANGPTLTFNGDVNNIQPGSIINAQATGLFNFSLGNYTYNFTLSDGVISNTETVTFTLLSSPDLAVLQSPPNNATLTDNTPDLNWTQADRATNYTIEIATDPEFTNIIQTVNQTGTTFTANALPGAGVYYWRVSANNSCGSALTSAFNFEFLPSSTRQLLGRTMKWEPNPTAHWLNISFSTPLDGELAVEVLTVAGQRVWQQYWNHAPAQLAIDLGDMPAATYLVRLTSNGQSVTERIIKQ